MITQELQEKLISLSKQALEKSYSPYSKFAVAAAVLTEKGDIFTGCNIENISYGLSICGERAAIFKMISEKGPQEKIKAIAITTKPDIPCTPCGACRQVIQEFSLPDTLVIFKSDQDFVAMTTGQILPGAFTEFTALDQDGTSKRIQKGV